jgi:hypothetical protein
MGSKYGNCYVFYAYNNQFENDSVKAHSSLASPQQLLLLLLLFVLRLLTYYVLAVVVVTVEF